MSDEQIVDFAEDAVLRAVIQTRPFLSQQDSNPSGELKIEVDAIAVGTPLGLMDVTSSTSIPQKHFFAIRQQEILFRGLWMTHVFISTT